MCYIYSSSWLVTSTESCDTVMRRRPWSDDAFRGGGHPWSDDTRHQLAALQLALETVGAYKNIGQSLVSECPKAGDDASKALWVGSIPTAHVGSLDVAVCVSRMVTGRGVSPTPDSDRAQIYWLNEVRLTGRIRGYRLARFNNHCQ